MGLDALALELSRLMHGIVRAPLKPDEPVRTINFTDDRALFYVLVSKRVGNVACITTVQLVRPPAISTENLTSAYEIALTKAINETYHERIVGKELFVSMTGETVGAGARAAAAHVAGIIGT
ncbi:MAG: hypothetical protein EBZ40_11370 [Gammaproteobacteria bacterium]|nr:hypothetical protein [Gammaproteobacteria bacterium]